MEEPAVLVVHVTYFTEDGKKDDFLKEVEEIDFLNKVRREPGNMYYDYYFPMTDPNAVFIAESWEYPEAFEAHQKTEHAAMLQDIKKKYVTSASVRLYEANEKNFIPTSK
jgi:quinol monooxygenase YgiN